MHLRVACSAGALALVVLLGACGSGQPAATASETTAGAADSTTTVAGNTANTAYRECLAQHGVTLPDRGQGPNGATPPDSASGGSPPPDSTRADSIPPGSFPGGPNGTQDPATQAAFDACASLRPEGGNGFGNGNGGVNSQAMQAYLSCLKDNGVDVPDTTATSGPPASIDRSSPAFAAANAKCEVLLPQRGDGSATTTTQG